MNKEIKWSQQYGVRLEEQEVTPRRPHPREEARPPLRHSHLVSRVRFPLPAVRRPGLGGEARSRGS